MSGRGGRGFLFGAAGGLVLALVVVGVASLVPSQGRQSSTIGAVTVAAASMSGPASTSGASSGASTPSTQPNGSLSNIGQSSHVPSIQPVQTTTTTAAAQPGSALATLPSESLGGLLSVAAPVFVGLLLAGLAYAVFLRRQDES